MIASGKDFRWSRFTSRDSGRALIVPIDHGVTMGPVAGLGSVREIGGWIGHSAINGIVAHKGMAAKLGNAGLLRGLGLMMHLNASTAIGEDPDTKHMVTSIETAVRLGADAVSLQVNFRPYNHAHNLKALGAVVDEADRYGLPVMAMVYPLGRQDDAPGRPMRIHRHVLRIAYELGVDVVKTGPPEHVEDIGELLEDIGEDLRVVFSGGALASDESLLGLAKAVANSNAAGMCVGRNVFQRPDPGDILSHVRGLLDG